MRTMEQAARELVALAAKHIVDMAVCGGSALAVAYDLRTSTKDIDAVKGYVNPNEAGI